MSDVPERGGRRLAVYAVGGNALSNPALVGEEAEKASRMVMQAVLDDVVDLLEAGFRVVLTHGNGPQVGELLLMEEALYDRRKNSGFGSPPSPLGLDNWVAATQGTLGHDIATRLDNTLRGRGRHEQVVALLTRVVVSLDDPRFTRPTKPIGPLIDDLDAVPDSWVIGVTKDDVGARRVVPSPVPVEIVDLDAIELMLEAGAVVLCCGGGGIPVAEVDGCLSGIEAVIDKDLVTSLLSVSLGADLFVVSTAVDSIKLDFGTDDERAISTLTLEEAGRHLSNGQFPLGSMGPKVDSMILAKKGNPKMAVILCSPGQVMSAIRGEKGTTLLD